MKRTTILAATLGILLSPPALAAWPEKPIKVIVPFAAGGQSDQTVRVLQTAIQEAKLLAQPLTVINVGGHFSIGSRQVLEAPPDGYTLLLVHNAIMSGEGSGAMNFGWRNYEAIAATGEFCVLPVVRKDSGIKSIKQLLDLAKEKPDTLVFGANLGAVNHIAGIMMEQASPGSKFRFVQIGGGAANFTALTGKQVAVSVLSDAEAVKFTLLPNGQENPESQVRALAYTGSKRSAGFPALPTLKEAGYDMHFCIRSWWFAPKGTPKAAIDSMATALEKASATDRVKTFYTKSSTTPLFMRGDELKADLAATWARIEPVSKLAKKK